MVEQYIDYRAVEWAIKNRVASQYRWGGGAWSALMKAAAVSTSKRYGFNDGLYMSKGYYPASATQPA